MYIILEARFFSKNQYLDNLTVNEWTLLSFYISKTCDLFIFAFCLHVLYMYIVIIIQECKDNFF